jgi:hypothetical protein
MNVSAAARKKQPSKSAAAAAEEEETETARVSPVQSSSTAAAATASASTAATSGNKRKDPPHSAPTEEETVSEAGTDPAAKPVSDIKDEVRALLEDNLIGKPDAVKLKTLVTLVHLYSRTKSRNVEKDEYRRAIVEWDGCRKVLAVLRQELDRGSEQANGLVVQASLRFLQLWNFYFDLRAQMMQLDGVGTVARSMKAFHSQYHIIANAVMCLYNLTCGEDAPRLRRLVEEGCIPLLTHALPALKNKLNTKKLAVLALERLSRVSAAHQLEAMADANVLEALSEVYHSTKDSDEAVFVACSDLMNNLLY